MATRVLFRSIISTANQTLISRIPTTATPSSILRLRPLIAAAASLHHAAPVFTTIRAFSTRQTTSSLNDSNPNWSNRPPKETILLDGCDFEHWLVVVDKPEGDPTRDEIIDSYINTLAKVVGSYDEARMKIYSVSTRCYYAFGALVPEEDSFKLKELPGVRWVLPDSYLDVKNKDYGGEPFIDGKAVPYDPKYHEEWIRNNARANERNRRNDRPRNFDRSRNFERRRENVQNNRLPPPSGNMGGPPNAGGAPPSGGPMGGPPNNMGGPPNVVGAPPSGNMGPPPNVGGAPPSGNFRGMQQGGSMGGPPTGGGGGSPYANYNGGSPNMGGGMPPRGGMPNNAPNYQQQNNAPNYQQQNYAPSYQQQNNAPNYQQQQPGYGPNSGAPYQSGPGPNGYAPPNVGGGNPYQTQDLPGRDMPSPPNYSQNY
ncbi:multiple organellar RNA editing factor 8, chloroplastic/mitochondrial-like [Rutidosis leptorrhynchoides]|uniref:multiple organellar RNA editing factor 8, chloroplastic/mitochondrial-like n=1 Tax=Rutidosis leptorrhynchoides TaxID=125765 RepID=UPI003A9A1045